MAQDKIVAVVTTVQDDDTVTIERVSVARPHGMTTDPARPIKTTRED